LFRRGFPFFRERSLGARSLVFERFRCDSARPTILRLARLALFGYEHPMLSLFEIAALLLVLSAFFAWVNTRFIGLPQSIGLLVMALCTSLALMLIDRLIPGSDMRETVTAAVAQIDFFDTLMNGMLAFLLFAGALHVDFGLLKNVRWPVGVLATIGVVISTALVGCSIWLAAQAMGVELPLAWALVFGALISPTDPVAVLSLLKSVHIPERLEMKIAGESLFNDGVGVVVFSVLLSIALRGSEPDFIDAAEIFLIEAVGGVALGLAGGFVAVRAMQAIDDYSTEILLSLALVTGVYALASALHTSGPLAVVVAGLLVGNRGAAVAMSETTRRYLFEFWETIDELLNAVLFLLIGLEVLVIGIRQPFLGLALAAIPLVLVARFAAIVVPLSIPALRRAFSRGSVAVLTWGGVRGGISVALALSVPYGPFREPILIATYAVVIFSVIVQGLTIRGLVRHLEYE
jgi:Na+:H+ antiporter